MKARWPLALLAVVLALIACPLIIRAARTTRVASAVVAANISPTATHIATPTHTPAPTKTNAPTNTLQPTKTPSNTPTRTPTNTITPTNTPPPTKTPVPTKTPAPTKTPVPTNTPAPTDTPAPTVAPTDTPAPQARSLYWGVSMAGVPDDIGPLLGWETNVAGKAVSIVHWGHFWMQDGGYQPWTNIRPDNARNHGAIPMISWTPEGGAKDDLQLSDIIAGRHDDYIRAWAADAKNWAHPFFLRMMHEMNGSWGFNWQEQQNGNQPGEFVQAWRHIVDIFRQVGVTNASYVWCPNVDQANSTFPSFASLYPGDDYVDWTCLDGYNWGPHLGGWQSFDQIYRYSYQQIQKIAPSKPLIIGEFGCVEEGGSKAGWLADALSKQIPQKYTAIRAVVYYNRQADGVDWRGETSPTSQNAWRTGIAAPFYLSNVFGSLETSPIPAP